jgi:hypothetical protein
MAPALRQLGIAIVPGGPPGYHPAMAGYVREALDTWDLRRLGLRWAEVQDTAGAAISVHWIDRFLIDRAGQTDLTWDRNGRIHRAVIVLAIHDTAGSGYLRSPCAVARTKWDTPACLTGGNHRHHASGAMAPVLERDNRTSNYSSIHRGRTGFERRAERLAHPISMKRLAVPSH